MTPAGTEVAASRLTKLETLTVLLIADTSLTWPVFTRSR
jgi:hypothetical protein